MDGAIFYRSNNGEQSAILAYPGLTGYCDLIDVGCPGGCVRKRDGITARVEMCDHRERSNKISSITPGKAERCGRASIDTYRGRTPRTVTIGIINGE